MKIVNSTDYDSKHLRAIIRWVAGNELTPVQRKTLVVHVYYGRGRWPSCQQKRLIAQYCLVLMLPHTFSHPASKQVLGVQLAWAMARYICGGARALTKGAPRYSFSGNWREHYAYLAGLPLEQRVPVVKKVTPAIRVGTRLQHARDQVKRWDSKLRLAETKIKTWNTTVKYYERRARTLGVPAAKPVRKPRKRKEDVLKEVRESLLQKGAAL